jgi:hypothetical protein
VLTWIDGGEDKGWTTHYRAKHMPLSDEFKSVIDFLAGFNWFPECPEYDFEGCWWRFTPFEKRGDGFFDSNAEVAHRWFDAHSANFSAGIKGLLSAHAVMEPWGMSFLPPPTKPHPARVTLPMPEPVASKVANPGYVYDVAFSFAGTERKLAEEIATIVRGNGFSVFYDSFYPEQLWGKDLVATFDRIYRKESRYCIMFISSEYALRIWTSHERRSATARALQERGKEYILPVRVEDMDIDGLPPSVGHVSVAEYSTQQIADLLVKKLKG